MRAAKCMSTLWSLALTEVHVLIKSFIHKLEKRCAQLPDMALLTTLTCIKHSKSRSQMSNMLCIKYAFE